jgi:chromosome segregation ATPase
MRTTLKYTLFALALAVVPAGVAPGADSTSQAAMVKEKIQSLRTGCAQGRNQITLTLEELTRLLAPGVELRPQFERFKGELAKMEAQATSARERAADMREKGQNFFADWEAQVRGIQNEKIREAAADRLAKRVKSYNRIIASMQEAKDQLVPFLSDLNDIKTLLDGELTPQSVASAKDLIKKANYAGSDVKDALVDVEKELDRVSAELATYQ